MRPPPPQQAKQRPKVYVLVGSKASQKPYVPAEIWRLVLQAVAKSDEVRLQHVCLLAADF